MLKKITIENYRSCLRTSFECNPHLSVLIGPNSSGKTNILQAIMLLNKMAQDEEQDRIEKERITTSSKIQAVFSLPKVRVRLTGTVSVLTDESNRDRIIASRQKWALVGKNAQHTSFELPLLAGSMFSREPDNWGYLLSRKQYRFKRGYFYHMGKRMFTLKEQPPQWADDAIPKIWQFCSGLRYYGASQFTNPSDCPVSFEIEKEGQRRGLYRLGRHARMLYDMYEASKHTSHETWNKYMSAIGPAGLGLIDDISFKEITTSSTDFSVRVGGRLERRKRDKLLIIPQFRIGKRRLSPNQLSEGTFKTVVLLFYIMTADSTALLIEEPEVCIHHGLLSSILELIKKYSKDKQIIVSTHSDYVLDHVKPENVFRVSYNRLTGSVVHHIRKTMTAREYAALRDYLDQQGNLGEYWREGGLEESQ